MEGNNKIYFCFCLKLLSLKMIMHKSREVNELWKVGQETFSFKNWESLNNIGRVGMSEAQFQLFFWTIISFPQTLLTST